MKTTLAAAIISIAAATPATASTAAWRCYDGRYEQRVERGISIELGSRVSRVEDTHCTATGRQWWYTTTLVYASPPPDLTAWRCVPRRVAEYRWRKLAKGTGPFRKFPSWRVGVLRLPTESPQWRGLVCAGLVPYQGENEPQGAQS